MMTVYLLRHGETPYNADGNRYCGTTDVALTEKGIAQAKAIGQRLQPISFDAIYASPLQRAYNTAALACHEHLPVTKDERLTELDFGTWEGKTREEFIAENPSLWEQWDSAPEKYRAGGTGNTAAEIVSRVDEFFMEKVQQYSQGTLLVVAHNTVNRLYLAYKLGMPLRNYRRIVQENSAITSFTLSSQGELTLHQLNAR
ncbi:hypothetical protein GCM10023231_29860 [Olivibacter ginsenosidimutans]|uniref:phosphoglycerate mutase (2,3-diphosphoglycerate-dependent) n=1 Tax=Olivibacter ginsenosidimutans TaxID=1176537 RepID=A0ABP9BQT7_9SPHI